MEGEKNGEPITCRMKKNKTINKNKSLIQQNGS